jgi:transcriptional regulator with XRE-family HTH domain
MADDLTRTEVAARLGVSVATVRRLEGKTLNPTRDARGRHLFDPDEVNRVAARQGSAGFRRRTPDAGELAARAFELFEERASLHDCVKALRLTPDDVYELWKKWRRGDFQDWQRHEANARKLAEDRRREASREARHSRALNRMREASRPRSPSK